MRAARRELERAQELYASAGASREAALVQAVLGNTEWQLHESERALERLQSAYAVLAEAERDEGFAAVAAELARMQFFMGDLEAAQTTIDAALEAAEQLWLPETLSQGLNTAGLIITGAGRWEQGYALIKRSLEIALENDLTAAALRAYNNVGDMLDRRDRFEEAIEVLQPGIALARKVGARASEWRLLGELAFMLLWLGRYDEARAAFEHIPEHGLGLGASYALPIFLAATEGDIAEARRLQDANDIGKGEDADEQDRIGYLTLEAMVANAEGEHERALQAAMPAVEARLTSTSKLGWEEALVAARALGRDEVVRDLVSRVESMAPGQLPPTLRAHAIRFRALLGDDPDQRFRAAAAAFREYGTVFHAAKVQTEHGEWLLREGRSNEAEEVLSEARAVLERLGARPWLDRVDAALPSLARVHAQAT
jgi:tetratricopeptide (TPR) repeat protein